MLFAPLLSYRWRLSRRAAGLKERRRPVVERHCIGADPRQTWEQGAPGRSRHVVEGVAGLGWFLSYSGCLDQSWAGLAHIRASATDCGVAARRPAEEGRVGWHRRTWRDARSKIVGGVLAPPLLGGGQNHMQASGRGCRGLADYCSGAMRGVESPANRAPTQEVEGPMCQSRRCKWDGGDPGSEAAIRGQTL